MKNRETKERLRGINGLGMLGEKAAPAARNLCALTLDPNARVVTATLDALSKVRPDLHPHIFAVVVDGNMLNRIAGLRSLENLGQLGSPATPVIVGRLQKLVASPNQLQQEAQAAFVCLRQIAGDDATLLPQFLIWARNSYSAPPALVHLGCLGEARPELRKKILPVLKAELPTPNQVIAMEAVAKFGPDAKECLPVLKGLRFNADVKVRTTAENAIARIEGGEVPR